MVKSLAISLFNWAVGPKSNGTELPLLLVPKSNKILFLLFEKKLTHLNVVSYLRIRVGFSCPKIIIYIYIYILYNNGSIIFNVTMLLLHYIIVRIIYFFTIFSFPIFCYYYFFFNNAKYIKCWYVYTPWLYTFLWWF